MLPSLTINEGLHVLSIIIGEYVLLALVRVYTKASICAFTHAGLHGSPSGPTSALPVPSINGRSSQFALCTGLCGALMKICNRCNAPLRRYTKHSING